MTIRRPAEAVSHEIEHRRDLLASYVELFHDLLDAQVLKILDHGNDGQASVAEHPSATRFIRNAFHRRALRPIESGHASLLTTTYRPAGRIGARRKALRRRTRTGEGDEGAARQLQEGWPQRAAEALALVELSWMTINVELRDEQAARLDRFAAGSRKSRVEATAQLIEEGLRRAEFPAIEFRDSPAGRQAFVVGSGLAVWEVLMVAEGYGLEAGETATHLRLDRDFVSQVLRYASAFEPEVRGALDENRAMTLEKLRASLPDGAWVDIR
jgi:uncharacterized protein (DUF433 family)